MLFYPNSVEKRKAFIFLEVHNLGTEAVDINGMEMLLEMEIFVENGFTVGKIPMELA